jgi:hypothetical protein
LETDNDFLRNLSQSFPKQSMEELMNMETTGTSLARKTAPLLEASDVFIAGILPPAASQIQWELS